MLERFLKVAGKCLTLLVLMLQPARAVVPASPSGLHAAGHGRQLSYGLTIMGSVSSSSVMNDVRDAPGRATCLCWPPLGGSQSITDVELLLLSCGPFAGCGCHSEGFVCLCDRVQIRLAGGGERIRPHFAVYCGQRCLYVCDGWGARWPEGYGSSVLAPRLCWPLSVVLACVPASLLRPRAWCLCVAGL